MTPEEKARDLVKKFHPLADGSIESDTQYDSLTAWMQAKKCALICVEEVLASSDLDAFWNNVKTEIEKL